jgi:hypothetical protein
VGGGMISEFQIKWTGFFEIRRLKDGHSLYPAIFLESSLGFLPFF